MKDPFWKQKVMCKNIKMNFWKCMISLKGKRLAKKNKDKNPIDIWNLDLKGEKGKQHNIMIKQALLIKF